LTSNHPSQHLSDGDAERNENQVDSVAVRERIREFWGEGGTAAVGNR
jgi:hypothetical protein